MSGRFRTVRRWWNLWARDFVVLAAIALSAWSSIQAQDLADQARDIAAATKAEAKGRINETCRIQETKQRVDVDALKRTYEYLSGLNAKQLAEPLNKAVLAGLPQTIREAQTDDAPRYCDAPNVGLPEPDPRQPKRPPGLPG